MNKLIMVLAVITLVLTGATNVLARDGNSGREDGHRGGDDENRFRIELRGDDDNLSGLEFEDNTFEVTGMVSAFTADTVTVGTHTIIINPSLVDNFEQEGNLMIGETIKVEGMVAPDGSFLAREIESNGVEDEDEDEDGHRHGS